MMTVNSAADLAYYLGRHKRGSEPFAIPEATTVDGKPHYYDPLAKDDPLAVPAIWVGKLASSLGLHRGAAVNERSLSAMWFAMDPRDDTKSLLTDGPTVAQQMAAEEAVSKATNELFNVTDRLSTLRKRLFNEGSAPQEINDNARVVKLTLEVEGKKAALKKAKDNPDRRASPHDLTFSAPKGVSVLWARYKTEGQDGNAISAEKAAAMEKAMVDSVADIIEKYIEPELLFTRKRIGNKELEYNNVKGIASALFTHFDARPTEETVVDPSAPGGKRIETRLPDPQMHVHSLLMAMGMDFDDEVRALWTTFLGKHAHAIGAAFRGELAHKLRGMGLDLKVDEQDKILAFDITGVTDEVAGNFSARRAQVVANMAKGLDGEAAALEGRVVKSEFEGKDLLSDWNRRLDEMGLTSSSIEEATNVKVAFQQAAAAMDEAEKIGAFDFERGSEEWIKTFDRKRASILAGLEGEPMTVDRAIDQLLEMETAFSMVDIHRLAFEASQFCGDQLKPGQSPMEWAQEFRADILRRPELIQTHELDNFGRPTFTSRGLIRREKELYFKSVPAMLAARDDALNDQEVEAAIARYEAIKTKAQGSPFELQDFQRQMIREIAMSPGSIHIALAPAGCGKTTAALGAVMAFEAAGGRLFSLAPSNKAAQGLAADLMKKRSEGISPQKLLALIKAGSVSLKKSDILLVDEASMIDFETAKGLVDAALSAKGGPARIVLQGDTEQLPAVGRGNFLKSLVDSDAFVASGVSGQANITRVSANASDWVKINRQRDDLGKQATNYFALGEAAKALEIYERMGVVKLHATEDAARAALAYAAIHPLAGLADNYARELSERKPRLDAFGDRAESAVRAMASDRKEFTPEAFLERFDAQESASALQWLEDREALDRARRALVKAQSNTLMLATRNVDVHELNAKAREILKSIGALGGLDGKARANIARGRVGLFEVCEGERLMFTQKADGSVVEFSEKGDMAAKTTVGTVVRMFKSNAGDQMLVLELDGQKGSEVTVNTRTFNKFNYAYAMTAHASQGVTCDNVYKFVSEFAAMQTEYVGDSRHREALMIFGVESQYKSYMQRAQEAIVKLDAKDMAFAQTDFSLDEQQLADLDAGIASRAGHTAAVAKQIEAARQRSIAQGALVESGHAPMGFKPGRAPSFYAKISLNDRETTLWGSGIEDALRRSGAEVGKHIGLEAMSIPSAGGSAPMVEWRAYSSDDLSKAGLLLDEAGLRARAKQMLGGRKAADKAARESIEKAIESPMVGESDALAIAEGAIAKASAVAATRAKEKGVLAELNLLAALPGDLEARLDAAMACLPFALPAAPDKVRGCLAHGVDVMPYQRPMYRSARTWLALDDELAYCLTEWGTVEAWSNKRLDREAIEEAKAGGSIERLAARHAQALEKTREVGARPVKAALSGLGSRVAVSVVEHSKHGLCIGVAAAVAGSHRSDPELARLFAGEGSFGDQAAKKKNGIGGLKSCKGFDPASQAWLFKLDCDATGSPKSEQASIREVVELGERLGHATTFRTEWDVRKGDAWSRIESRMTGPWGLAFTAATARAERDWELAAARSDDDVARAMKKAASPESPGVALRSLIGKSADIVRWDARVLNDLDTTLEWQLCSVAKDADAKPMRDGARRVAGLIMHADEKDVYIRRDQRILAIERSALGLTQPAETIIGDQVGIHFAPGELPTLEFHTADPMMRRGREIALRISAGASPDTAKVDALWRRALARAEALGSATAEEKAFGLAWSRRESSQWELIRSARSEGLSAAAEKALPLEALGEPSKSLRKRVKVLEVGAKGALLRIGKDDYLADREQMLQALPRQLQAGKEIAALKIQRDGLGRASVDAPGTIRALELAQSKAAARPR